MNEATKFLTAHSGAMLFGVVLLEQLGLPLPAMPWLLAAGALTATGEVSPTTVLCAAILGCLVADSAWFYLGRRSGKRVVDLLCKLSLEPNSCVRRSEDFLARHAEKGLVAAKFLPWIGMVIPPLAGRLGMSYRRFLLFDGLGSVLYVSCGVLLGFIFSQQLHEVFALLRQFGFGAFTLALTLVAGYTLFKILKKKGSSRRTQDNAGGLRLTGGRQVRVENKAEPSGGNECASDGIESRDEPGISRTQDVNATLAL